MKTKTPPSDVTIQRKSRFGSQRETIISARDIALRGNMPRVLECAANGHSKIGLTRAEIVRQVKEARPKAIKKYPKRVALVSRIKGGFHVVGLGNVKSKKMTLNTLKEKLGIGFIGSKKTFCDRGFTHLRFKGQKKVQSLFVRQ